MNLRSAAMTAVLLSVACIPAAAAGDVPGAFLECAAVSNDQARLACYDKLAAQMKAAAPAAPAVSSTPAAVAQAAPAAVAADNPPTKKQEESWFGLGGWFDGNGTPPVRQTAPQQFGSETIPQQTASAAGGTQSKELDSISATVTDVAFNPFGRFTVFLDNGQIWKQVPGDTDRAYFGTKKKNTVTISRGFLGSYNLAIDGRNGIYKVQRVK